MRPALLISMMTLTSPTWAQSLSSRLSEQQEQLDRLQSAQSWDELGRQQDALVDQIVRQREAEQPIVCRPGPNDTTICSKL